MADVPMQVIVAAFKDIDGASNALKTLQDARREKFIIIEDAAVITKDANGKVKIKDTADMGAGKGATIGAITGGVIGLLAGPVGWVALGGGVIGGLAAKLHDSGFPDDQLKQLSAGLTPNSSALVAVIDHVWVAEVERELASQQADLVTQTLSNDIHQQLTGGGEVVYTVVSDGEAVVAARETTAADVPAELPDTQASPPTPTPPTPTPLPPAP